MVPVAVASPKSPLGLGLGASGGSASSSSFDLKSPLLATSPPPPEVLLDLSHGGIHIRQGSAPSAAVRYIP